MSGLEPTPFAGLVLAGGEGARWGGPKAWAQLPDGRRFLDACVSLLEDAGASPVVATLPPASRVTEGSSIDAAVLPRAGLDMFGSLRIGLARLLSWTHWQSVVVLPVDHPLVASTTVGLLVGAGPPAAIPTLRGRHGHPICLWRPLAERVALGDLRHCQNLREALREVASVDVAVRDPGVRANCNTPQALDAALEEQHRADHSDCREREAGRGAGDERG